jgi:hypothetical protein
MVDKVPPIVIEIFNLKIETDEAICDYVIILDIIKRTVRSGRDKDKRRTRGGGE